MAELVLEDVTRRFADGTVAVDAVSLDAADGELLVVLGASGAGKSTLLALVAGLDGPTAGRVLLAGRDVTTAPPAARDVALVRPDAAPHPRTTVERHVGAGLRIRRRPRPEIRDRVRAEVRALGLGHLLERRSGTLSAGERQVVQTARALVRAPAAFLLDEPLSQLDPDQQLRLRRQITLLQEGYGATTVWATADARHALALDRRVAVLHAGRLHQVGPARQLHDRPTDRVVAELVGHPPMAVVAALVEPDPPGAWLVLGGCRLRCWAPAVAAHAGLLVPVGVRPHDASLAPADEPGTVPGRVTGVEGVGPDAVARVALVDGQHLVVAAPTPAPRPTGAVAVRVGRAHVFHPLTGATLAHLAL